MRVFIVEIQVKPEFREQFVAATLDDARGSVEREPGCLRFDVVQDDEDPNRLHLYELYRDEAAVQAHLQAPHFVQWRNAVKDWYAAPPEIARGALLYPADPAV